MPPQCAGTPPKQRGHARANRRPLSVILMLRQVPHFVAAQPISPPPDPASSRFYSSSCSSLSILKLGRPCWALRQPLQHEPGRSRTFPNLFEKQAFSPRRADYSFPQLLLPNFLQQPLTRNSHVTENSLYLIEFELIPEAPLHLSERQTSAHRGKSALESNQSIFRMAAYTQREQDFLRYRKSIFGSLQGIWIQLT